MVILQGGVLPKIKPPVTPDEEQINHLSTERRSSRETATGPILEQTPDGGNRVQQISGESSRGGVFFFISLYDSKRRSSVWYI